MIFALSILQTHCLYHFAHYSFQFLEQNKLFPVFGPLYTLFPFSGIFFLGLALVPLICISSNIISSGSISLSSVLVLLFIYHSTYFFLGLFYSLKIDLFIVILVSSTLSESEKVLRKYP